LHFARRGFVLTHPSAKNVEGWGKGRSGLVGGEMKVVDFSRGASAVAGVSRIVKMNGDGVTSVAAHPSRKKRTRRGWGTQFNQVGYSQF
jgi:hypothetical protein